MQKMDITNRLLKTYIFGKIAENERIAFFDILKNKRRQDVIMSYMIDGELFMNVYVFPTDFH